MSSFIKVNIHLVCHCISHVVNLQGFNISIYISAYVCVDRICFQSKDKHHHRHILQMTDGNYYLFDCD